MIPAFAYLRVSGLTQAGEDRGGLPRQLAAVMKYAQDNGYQIVRVFRDEGVSGKTDLENRPALAELMSELGQVNVVIIEKLDRLARDLMISETIIGDLKRKHVLLLSVPEPDLCSDDPSRKLIRQIMSAIAEYDRALIVARLKAGADRARSQGKKWGGKPAYGRNRKHPEELSIVEKVRELNVQGMTLTAIATTLNDSGFKPRTGKKFYPMQIARILQQEELNGHSNGSDQAMPDVRKA